MGYPRSRHSEDTELETAKLPRVSLDDDGAKLVPGFLVAYSRGVDAQSDRFTVAPPFVMGRANEHGFPIKDLSLSQSHCRVFPEKDALFVEDLGSTNGTFLNGERVREGARLADGDLLRVGDVLLVFRTDVSPFLSRATETLGHTGRFHVADLVRDLERAVLEGAPVLLTGPTGAGKEVAANAIHRLHRREGRPFIRFNVAQLSSPIEASSMLFGVSEGAFSQVDGAPGLIEAADGGVLFLDEFHNLGELVQRQILRVVEDGELTRKGKVRSRRVDVKFVFSSNESGPEFGLAHDVLSRLRVVCIPPLRDRIADIPDLCEALLRKELSRHGVDPRHVVDQLFAIHYEQLCLDGFQDRNVRGLKDFVGRLCSHLVSGMPAGKAFATALSERRRTRFSASHLAASMPRSGASQLKTLTSEPADSGRPDWESTDKYERHRADILGILSETNGNLSAVCRAMKERGVVICRRTLRKHVEEWRARGDLDGAK